MSSFIRHRAGNERFNDVMQLNDGRVLVVGVADDLGWLPGGVPQSTLAVPESPRRSSTN